MAKLYIFCAMRIVCQRETNGVQRCSERRICHLSPIITFAAAVAVGAAIAVPVSSTGWDVDYLEEMVCAAVEGDYEVGENAAQARNEKIEQFGLDETEIEFEDLYLLSKIMYAEAGSVWLPDDWKMCVGEVVLNRVESPEFADTIRDVLDSPGQYYPKGDPYFEDLRPSERCVRLAIRLLEGERVLDDPSVVFQANFKLGGGIHTEYMDEQLGASYFCYSIHPKLYPSSGLLSGRSPQLIRNVYDDPYFIALAKANAASAALPAPADEPEQAQETQAAIESALPTENSAPVADAA